jgi:hypothetical protein
MKSRLSLSGDIDILKVNELFVFASFTGNIEAIE